MKQTLPRRSELSEYQMVLWYTRGKCNSIYAHEESMAFPVLDFNEKHKC